METFLGLLIIGVIYLIFKNIFEILSFFKKVILKILIIIFSVFSTFLIVFDGILAVQFALFGVGALIWFGVSSFIKDDETVAVLTGVIWLGVMLIVRFVFKIKVEKLTPIQFLIEKIFGIKKEVFVKGFEWMKPK